MQLFDAHCHLQDARLRPRLPELLAAARTAGVARWLCCGTGPDDWTAVRELARSDPAIRPAFGLHPWRLAAAGGGWLTDLERCLGPDPVAVGEIGLDHAVTPRDDAAQEEVFVAQLRLARRRRLPVCVHCRRAWARLLTLLEYEAGPAGGLVHAYSGPPELAPRLEALGFYLSFSAVLARPGNRRGVDAVARVSPERLLIETDSPDLPPPGAGGLNPPANLALVAETIAALRGVSLETLAAQTWVNAERLFPQGGI